MYKLNHEDIDYAHRLRDESKMPLYFIVSVLWGISYEQFKNRKERLYRQQLRDDANEVTL